MVTNYGPEMGLISSLRIAVALEDISDKRQGLLFLNYEPVDHNTVLVKSQATAQIIYKLTEDFKFNKEVFFKITPQQAINFDLSLTDSECIGKLNVTDHGGDHIARTFCKAQQFRLPLLKNWYDLK